MVLVVPVDRLYHRSATSTWKWYNEKTHVGRVRNAIRGSTIQVLVQLQPKFLHDGRERALLRTSVHVVTVPQVCKLGGIYKGGSTVERRTKSQLGRVQ